MAKRSNNSNNNILLIIGFIAVTLFILKAADGSLDFYGSIGFDMFKDKSPFDNNNKNNFNDEKEITVKIKINNKDKNAPDFIVSTKSTHGYIDGKTFDKNDGKAKVKLFTDENDKRVCIEAEDIKYKTCKNISKNNEVIFNLR